jgi:dTMP kinase
VEIPGGFFISFEGIEGCGKTTQARILADSLSAAGYEVVLTREPGGTVIGDRIRDILLDLCHGGMADLTEILLYNAARVQHLAELVMPSLALGRVVITDRFTDSTVAYQGYGRGIDLSVVMGIDGLATKSFRPHLTVLLDLPAEGGLGRNREARKVDRLELEHLDFHRRVREGFLRIARAEPWRVEVMDASRPVSVIKDEVWGAVTGRLQTLKGRG